MDLKLKALRRLALSLKESTGLFFYAQPCTKFLKEKRKKESSLIVGVGWLSSFFEKILPGFIVGSC
ncbi:MAG: hypothetical protein ACYC01_09770 [Lutibacter sp.]